jgi:hypothetical protein
MVANRLTCSKQSLHQMIGFPYHAMCMSGLRTVLSSALSHISKIKSRRTATGDLAATVLLPALVATLTSVQSTFDVAPQMTQDPDQTS